MRREWGTVQERGAPGVTADIVELDERTVSQIAAGEVVERPASVAKELLENSLDANASRIDVSVEDGGQTHLLVADDGVGMTESAVRKAIEQHTTSKIRDIEDLETGLSTLGFRGEALYTIGAVSRMTITTRPRDGPDTGTELRVVGGDVETVRPAGRAPGTTVTVEDLFFNKPARRKFLKTETTEFAHVNRIVTRYALANPEVAVTLDHDDSTVFSTTGSGRLLDAINSVYGRTVADAMVGVESSPDGPIEAISGYVSDPETNRAGSEYVSTFVNGRYVRAGLLREAIVEAYGKQLAADRFPFAVLFLQVPPNSVDVNVHPRKLDVRFDDDSAVFAAIEEAVRDSLLSDGLIRSSAPRGRSAPQETQIERERGDEEPSETGAVGSSGTSSSADTREDSRSSDSKTNAPEGDAQEDTPSVDGETDAPSDGEQTSTERGHGSTTPATEPRSDDASSGPPGGDPSNASTESGRDPSNASTESETDSASVPSDRTLSGRIQQEGLDESPREPSLSTLPSLTVLGQIQNSFVVAESPDGLLVIDQHAADERIRYERLAERLAGSTHAQSLVSPVRLEVTAQEASVFESVREDLIELGFEATLDGQTLIVEAVPAVFSETLEPELLRDLLGSFLDETGSADPVSQAADALLADMACYPAITGNTPLHDGDVLDLLETLDECENPYSCPHGRPVVIEISSDELEDRFERDYPGHQNRRPEG
ncbi:MAG: DNA mismatch repair endonuclease MutL [Halodesulfurarchaeum sp.]